MLLVETLLPHHFPAECHATTPALRLMSWQSACIHIHTCTCSYTHFIHPHTDAHSLTHSLAHSLAHPLLSLAIPNRTVAVPHGWCHGDENGRSYQAEPRGPWDYRVGQEPLAKKGVEANAQTTVNTQKNKNKIQKNRRPRGEVEVAAGLVVFASYFL